MNMAQSSLRQFYAVRKRPQEEHGSLKRRKLTEESRLDIPVVGKDADPSSLPFNQPRKVSTTKLQDSTSTITCRSTTRSKSRGRSKAAGPRGRRKPPPTKQATPSLVLPSCSQSKQLTSDGSTERSSTTATITDNAGPSSQTHEEESLLPSSPKTPKRAPSTSSLPPSSPTASPPASQNLPPTRSRKNLAQRMKLASSDTHTSSPTTHPPQTANSSTQDKLFAKTIPNISAKDVAQCTRSVKKTLAEPSSSGDHTTGGSDRSDLVRRLYNLSAKELALRTDPERQLARKNNSKCPATPTSHGPQLHQFKSFVVESPTKSPSKQPAYQRYHSLAQTSSEPTPDLPLPYKYQVLLEKFRCTDTVVTMLQKRREICTFNKLKQAVEEMTRRKYENRNLAQMGTVYPKAFIFRQEKNIPGIYDRKTFESYQLTVECNVQEDGRGEDTTAKEETVKEEKKSNVVLDSSALVRRRKVFNKNLNEIARRHHKQFLSSLDPPLDIPDEKIVRWHPAFQLDTVPDIEEAELPKPPITECYTTARDVLNMAHERLAPRVQQALEGVAESSTSKPAKEEEKESSTGSQINPALRGVSLKLLEKIQQKEASRVRSAITRDPAKEKRLEMLARLPDLCRIIRSFFVTEKKAAIPWESVVQKLSESHTSSLSPDQVEEHLAFMKESLGGWLNVVEVRKRRFVKIIKNTDTHVLTARMEAIRKKLLV